MSTSLGYTLLSGYHYCLTAKVIIWLVSIKVVVHLSGSFVDLPFQASAFGLRVLQSARIDEVYWVVGCVSIDVKVTRRKTNRIFLQETTRGGVVNAGAVVIEPAFGIILSGRIEEGVLNALGRALGGRSRPPWPVGEGSRRVGALRPRERDRW